MTSVNDLTKQWERRWWIGDLSEAGEELDEVARTAWHPVSEPPTEADGADATPVGAIAVKTSDGCIAMPVEWGAVAKGECPSVVEWARIRDVVLLPPQSTTGEGE